MERYCPHCEQSFEGEMTVCPDDGSNLVLLADRVDPLLGRELDGRFKILERLGEGGMGAVYLAHQHSVGREVAIKIVRPGQEHLRAATKRFLREAKLASRLSQPNVVAVFDFGRTEDGLLYLVMERLRGRTLGDLLRAEGPFSVERMAHIGAQLCDALQAAHQLTIVHRDLKPANIMVLDEPKGRDLVKVLDFGLAKTTGGDESAVTESGLIVGTLSYIAPEVMEGMPADERGDLYALGVLFYLMLTNRLPFKDLSELRSSHPLPLPSSVPGVVQNVVARLLERDPAARMRSAAQAREALKAATRDAGAAWLSSSPAEMPVEQPTALEIPRRKKPRRWPILAGGVALLGGGSLFLLQSNNHPLPEVKPAVVEAASPSPSAEPPPVLDMAAPPLEKPQPIVKHKGKSKKKKPNEEFIPP